MIGIDSLATQRLQILYSSFCTATAFDGLCAKKPSSSRFCSPQIKMVPFLFLLLLASSLIPGFAQEQPNDQSSMSLIITEDGLDFVKDLLVNKAISSMIPLRLPKIEKTVKIPVVGNVFMALSNITIYQIDVPSSNIKPGKDGISILALGTTCILSMNWYYSYSTWLLPVEITDKGSASVQVEGMEVRLALGMENQEGSLKLVLKDTGCDIKDISINLDGGASWLYQGMVNAFEGQIGSKVDNAITKKLKEGISRLDSFFQKLPKEISVNKDSSLNVTLVGDPLLSDSSIGFGVNGLFIGSNVEVPKYWLKNPKLSVSCPNSSKMLGIAVEEAVFNSASSLFYNAKFMHWVVDKVPDRSLLNTAGWRFIVPQLYKKYPNHDMNLNISLSNPPAVEFSNHKAEANIFADLTIDVVEGDEIIPVACISLVIRASGSVKINGNNLAGTIGLDDLAMSLKWSNVGNLRMYLIQPIVWTLVQTVALPYANSHLSKGFPLPIIHGFTLQNAKIILSSSRVTVCSDVVFAEPHKLIFKSLTYLE